ncbi:MAG: MFS transporter [Inquilinus sp.]|nr:MFS transporter [Inquilinus sp.]
MAEDGAGQTDRAGSAGNRLPAGIWVLGMVSLFTDLSSELVHSLLPVFMVGTLGASTILVGIVEGIAEATASIVKIFSGALSDHLGRRKLLTVFGYGLAALSKPLFAVAPTIGWVFTARFVDRIGKGIRGAPRDALIADLTPARLRGAAFGLRQSLDTVGAFLGPLAAVGLMALQADDIRAVFWFAVIPALVAVVILVGGLREPVPSGAIESRPPPISLREIGRLPTAFWGVVAIGTGLALARFSEAFLVLRADTVGLPLTFVPLVMVVMSAVYALSAYPAGVLSDRVGRDGILAVGLIVLIVADLMLAAAQGPLIALIGVGLWGLHMGLTQGILATLVADTAPKSLRGTAFGLFNLIGGTMMFGASLLAGVLWHVWGATAPFWSGAGLTGLVLLAWSGNRRRLRAGAGRAEMDGS